MKDEMLQENRDIGYECVRSFFMLQCVAIYYIRK